MFYQERSTIGEFKTHLLKMHDPNKHQEHVTGELHTYLAKVHAFKIKSYKVTFYKLLNICNEMD